MGKRNTATSGKKKVEEKKATRYGTDPEMVRREMGEGIVLCEDEKGYYLTKQHIVGTKMLDGFRCYRRWDLMEGNEDLEIKADPELQIAVVMATAELDEAKSKTEDTEEVSG